ADPAQPPKQQKDRQHRRLSRQHDRAEHCHEQHVPPPEREARKRISRRRAGNQAARDRRGAEQHGVSQVPPERKRGQRRRIVLPVRRPWHPLHRQRKHLPLSLQRRRHHPQKRQRKHYRQQREREPASGRPSGIHHGDTETRRTERTDPVLDLLFSVSLCL